MSVASQSRLFDLAVAAAVTVSLPLVAFVVWPWISRWTTSPPQGVVLVYRVDPRTLPKGATIDLRRLARAMERRVNSGEKELAEVRRSEDGRIEVALLHRDDAERRQAEDLLARTATLEFRILASSRCDQAVIERAEADPSASLVLDDQGRLLARWTPVKPSEIKGLQDYDDLVQRTVKEGDKEVIEVLVLKDPYDLTGVYLTGAKAGMDRRGRPELELTFNTKGGRLFRELTGNHLPNKKAGLTRKLGIIVNNQLYSAPLIVSKIFDRAQIAGSFTKEEVADLVDRLDGGGLPARIELVDKHLPR